MRYKSFLLFTFYLLLVLSFSFFVSADMADCMLSLNPVLNYQRLGFVSHQGHFTVENSDNVDFLYGLYCSHFLVPDREDGVPTFYFSDPTYEYEVEGVKFNGSGHVSFSDEYVSGEAFLGFTEGDCEVVPVTTDCTGRQICVLDVSSNTSNAHVASCSQDNVPMDHNFQYRICCTPREICNDGIDNTGDGLVDCQSPDCHPSIRNAFTPQQCSPGPSAPEIDNNQSTSECIVETIIDGATGVTSAVFSNHCMGPNPDPLEDDIPYYCNYGFLDNSSVHQDGFCCPEGQYYDSINNLCQDFQKCGILEDDFCEVSFPLNTLSWIDWLLEGQDDDKWCHSHIPILRQHVGRSEACCPVMTHGTFDYFILDENVKIFGAE